MILRRHFVLLGALAAVVAVGILWKAPDGGPRAPPPAVISGGVRRLGSPAAAEVALYRYLSVDPQDPYAGFRGFDGHLLALRAAAATRPALATLLVGDDGRFRFEDVEPGLYEIHARAEDDAWGTASVVVPIRGVRLEVTVHLPHRTTWVSGRVRQADGQPFVGTVEAVFGWQYRPYWLSRCARVTRTDGEGRFRIDGLPRGRTKLAFVRDGEIRFQLPDVLLPLDAPIEAVVPTDSPVCKGRVVDAESGDGVPQARVLAWGGTPGLGRLAMTAEDGSYEVALPRGWRGTIADAPGFATWHVMTPAGSDELNEIRAWRTTTVRGRVVHGPNRRPVSGVPVYAVVPSPGHREILPWITATDEDGRFTLRDVWPGANTIFAWGGGWISPEMGDSFWSRDYDPHAYELPPGGTLDVKVEVVPAGRYEGRVVASEGADIAGSRVCALQAPLRDWRNEHFFFEDLAQGGVLVADDGHFVLDTISAERPLWLKVRAPSGDLVQAQHPAVASGERGSLAVARPAPRWLTVRLVAAGDGTPISDARLFLRRVWDREWRTNGEGLAHVGPIFDDDFEVRATAGGFCYLQDFGDWITEETLASLPAGEVAAIELERGRSWAGRLVAESDVPLELADVGPSDGFFLTPWVSGVSPDGAFVIHDLPDRAIEIGARLRWKGGTYYGTTVVEAGSAPGEIRLELSSREREPEPEFTVVVSGPDGKPVRHGSVRLHDLGSAPPGHSYADLTEGVATLRFPPEDAEVWLEVVPESDGDLGSAVVGPVDLTKLPVEVRLPHAKTIRGIVRSPDGTKVRRCSISAYLASVGEEDECGGLHASSRTDAEGIFLLEGLGPGRYRLELEVPSRYIAWPDIQVEAGADDVVVDLRPAASVTLRLVDEEGDPVGCAEVGLRAQGSGGRNLHNDAILRRRGWLGRGWSDAQGRVRIRRLDPEAAFDLRVSPPHGSSLLPLEQEGCRPWDQTLYLSRAFRIEGRVVDSAGRSIPDAVVHYDHAHSRDAPRRVSLDAHGRFEIAGLPAGTVELTVQLRNAPGSTDHDPDPLLRVEVPAGRRDVVLRLENVGGTLDVRIEGDVDLGGLVWAELASQDGPPSEVRALVSGGRVVFRGLDEGSHYSLWIHGEDAGWFVLERDLVPRDGAVVVEAKVGHAIRGRIGLPEFVDRERVTVSARSPEGHHADGTVAKDGSFEIVGLPEGEWQIWARVTDGGDLHQCRATHPAGARDVFLDLKPPGHRDD